MLKQYINTLVGNATRRQWDAPTIDKYVGDIKDVYLTHSQDGSFRSWSASGASVSAMLIHWLETGVIDGAVVCKTVVQEGKARGQFYIATNRQEVLDSRGSLYVEVKFAREALPLIEAFSGNLAMVGLPCHVDILRRRMRRDPETRSKIKGTIALVCGHSSQTRLIDGVTGQLEDEQGAALTGYHFRHGHWRGRLAAKFANGAEVEHPFSRFSMYQNLYFWSEKKCFQCTDHFGYRADISAGDVWSMNLKNDPVKHTCILVRTEDGEKLYRDAVESSAVAERALDIKEVLDGQARTAPFHYNLTARLKAAARYRLKLKDTVHEKVHWNHRLVAEMAMFNWAWSQHPKFGKLVFKVPRPILKAYLMVFKLLESF